MANRFTLTAAMAAIALAFTSACTVHQTEPPSAMGPSDFALSLEVSATPDSISQDGASQSSVIVTAHDANGGLKSGVTLRLSMIVDKVPQDFGLLSARTLVTGSDGRASAIYTAPAAPPPLAGGKITIVSIAATPTGTNAQTSNSRTVDIRLVPPGVILPPAELPIARFTMSPTPALANVPVIFDASTSDVGAGATQFVSYAWNFGDGGAGTGRTVPHTYTTSATFNVTLTVVNDRGKAASAGPTPVAVGALAAPTAKFVFSPAGPTVNQAVQFNGDQSTTAPGHALTQFNWNFGDGATGTGVVVSHPFASAGAYNVVLSVLDDTGQKGTVSQPVTVGAGAGGGAPTPPTARFVFSPTAPGVNQDVFVNGASSTASSGRTISSYSWDFGDGFTASGVTTQHAYTRSGTFTITLSITDDIAQSGTVSNTVNVGPASSQIVAEFVFSPTDPKIANGTNILVNFDATPSISPATIVSWVWEWGDGTANGPNAKQPQHTFLKANTYLVRLTVTDSAGRTATITHTVTIGA